MYDGLLLFLRHIFNEYNKDIVISVDISRSHVEILFETLRKKYYYYDTLHLTCTIHHVILSSSNQDTALTISNDSAKSSVFNYIAEYLDELIHDENKQKIKDIIKSENLYLAFELIKSQYYE